MVEGSHNLLTFPFSFFLLLWFPSLGHHPIWWDRIMESKEDWVPANQKLTSSPLVSAPKNFDTTIEHRADAFALD